jgi:hypothetical protein
VVKRIRARLTYANVMATIALFIALGGGSYAALSGKDKKKVKAIADQEIAAQAAGLSVAKAANATNAGHADTAGSADKAASADKATSADSAANAVNADNLDNLDSLDIGLGFFTGRLDNMAVVSGINVGAPSGVSTAQNDATTALSDENLTLSPNRAMVMRRLSVTLTAPVVCGGVCGAGHNVSVRIVSFPPGSGTVAALISCSIAVAASSCTAAGPSGPVVANSSLRVNAVTAGNAQFAATTTDVQFSWEATAS